LLGLVFGVKKNKQTKKNILMLVWSGVKKRTRKFLAEKNGVTLKKFLKKYSCKIFYNFFIREEKRQKKSPAKN
jgi:hypothetical protein